MRLAIVCNDTRGGVQPYVALAFGLRRAGFDVRAICPAHSSTLFKQIDIPVVEELGTAEEFVDASRRAAEAGVLGSIRLHFEEAAPRLQAWQEQTLRACEGAELILGGMGGLVTGLPAAIRLDVPFIQMHLQPIFAPSSFYPGVLAPELLSRMGRFGNNLGHRLSDSVVKLMLMGKYQNTDRLPIFYAFSQKIVPVQSSENTSRYANGYWTQKDLDKWSPRQDLRQFLDSADDVICVGFGSMVSKNPEFLYGEIIGAVRELGVKAVILTGWNGALALGENENIYVSDEIPHSWLFAKVSAIVHHGGAGTTGAAFLSGKPQIVIPFGVDQPFWGGRVRALGAGPSPIPRRKLNAKKLVSSLKQALTDKNIRQGAASLGQALQEEDGVGRTVQQLQDLFS